MANELSKNTLAKLAEIANKAADVAETHAVNAVSQAVVAGDALLAAKQKCEHGNWTQWLAANFARSEVTAQRYMRLAQEKLTVENADASAVRKALSAITESRKVIESKAPPLCAKTVKRDGFEEEKPTKTAVSDEPHPEPEGAVQGEIVEAEEDEIPFGNDQPAPVSSIVKDCLDRDVPDHLRDKFATGAHLAAIGRKVDGIKREVTELADQDGGWFLPIQEIELMAKDFKDKITESAYWTACPRCGGKGKGCKRCDDSGFIPKSRKGQLSAEDKEALGV